MTVTLYNYSEEGLSVHTQSDESPVIGYKAIFTQSFQEQALFFNSKGDNPFLRVVDAFGMDQLVTELGVKSRVESDIAKVLKGENYPVIDYLRTVLFICQEYKRNKDETTTNNENGYDLRNVFIGEMDKARTALNTVLENIEGHVGGKKEAMG